MSKLKRSEVLNLIAFAGYHQDQARFTRLYVENRVGYAAAKAAYRAGARQRAQGVRCDCHDCKKG